MEFTIGRPVVSNVNRIRNQGHGLDAMGMWDFGGVDVPPKGGTHRTEVDGITYETRHGDTCDRCGMSIQWIVTLTRKEGFIRVGSDCADYLMLDDAARVDVRRIMAEERAARRDAAREEKRAVARAARSAEHDAKVAACVAAHTTELAMLDVLVRASGFPAAFAADMTAQITQRGVGMSDKQRALLTRLHTELTTRKVSEHIGAVGDKVTFTGTCVYSITKASDRYYGKRDYIYTYRTDANDLVVWFASTDCGSYKGDRVTVTAKIKSLGEFRGEKQTVITRGKVAVHAPPKPATTPVAEGQWRGKDGSDDIVEIIGSYGGDLWQVACYDAEGRRQVFTRTADSIERAWPVVSDSAPASLPRVVTGEVRKASAEGVTLTVGNIDAAGAYDITFNIPGKEPLTITAMTPAYIVGKFPVVLPA